uniref:Uncharacterized protein n=1 Tax=Strigamia maritima TaxID=126957 RepID=T1J9D7_STRMM
MSNGSRIAKLEALEICQSVFNRKCAEWTPKFTSCWRTVNWQCPQFNFSIKILCSDYTKLYTTIRARN